MEETSGSNPIFVGLFFFARCVVPLAIMLGISYLLKRLGLIAEPPKPPPGWDNGGPESQPNGQEGIAHV